MITCREDLHKLVVDCSDIAMLELFIGKMVEFDIRWSDGSRADSYTYHEEFDATGLMVDGKLVSPVNYCDCLISGYRPVELSDFIPCNNVKYYDKDEEVKLQDRFVSNAIKELKISLKPKTEEELMGSNSVGGLSRALMVDSLRKHWQSCAKLRSWGCAKFDKHYYTIKQGSKNL